MTFSQITFYTSENLNLFIIKLLILFCVNYFGVAIFYLKLVN